MLRHFAEHGFHDVQPGAVLAREDKLEPLGMQVQPSLRLFGDVRRVVVEQEANPDVRGIVLV